MRWSASSVHAGPRGPARLAVACVALFGAGISAHHSLSPVYDMTKQVTVEGSVREFHFVNPHPYLLVEVAADGSPAVWRLELDNRHELIAAGMTAGTFAPGDRLRASGAPGRDQPARMYVRELDRADGFRYEQFTSTPRIILPRQ